MASAPRTASDEGHRPTNPYDKIIDCHVHVFDPARFPYAADAFYRPEGAEIGTAAQLGHLVDAHGVQHALIVGPNSGYGLDNRCILDALAQAPAATKALRSCATMRA